MPVVQAVSTPNDQTGGSRQPQLMMPAELVNQAASRLCWVSNLFAFTTIAMIFVQGYLQPEVREALKYMESGSHFGKIVIKIGE